MEKAHQHGEPEKVMKRFKTGAAPCFFGRGGWLVLAK